MMREILALPVGLAPLAWMSLLVALFFSFVAPLLLPVLNYPAGSVLCDGRFESIKILVSEVRMPGRYESNSTVRSYCHDLATGEVREIGAWIILVVSTVFYGLLLYLGILGWIATKIVKSHRAEANKDTAPYSVPEPRVASQHPQRGSASETGSPADAVQQPDSRASRLRQLLEKGELTQQEFDVLTKEVDAPGPAD